MSPDEKKCIKCLNLYPATSEYFHAGNTLKGLHSICKKCRNRAFREKWKTDPELRAKHTDKQRVLNDSLRCEVMTHYCGGEPSCQCCGEKHMEFLALDHVNGDGAQHRKEIGQGGVKIYRWAIKNNYPSSLQVLCCNCNWAKERYGRCPHEDEKTQAA